MIQIIRMPLYYVLVNSAPLKEHDVYLSLCKMENVKEVQPLVGEYDIIVKFECENNQKAEEAIMNHIWTMEGGSSSILHLI